MAGFASSLVFSCCVGTVCDRYGRKLCAIAYCVLYIVSCLTKHVRDYSVLMFGRVTGGIATSLLFSCFECWMVSEHLGRNRFSGGLLSYMFGLMFTTMYCVAILSGIVGELLVASVPFEPTAPGSLIYVGGSLGPFDLAIVCLIIGALLILAFWEENYGKDEDRTDGEAASMAENFTDAVRLFSSDRRMWLIGMIVACFEGSMYAFVFNWTPALESPAVPPPYGLIFALFMMACMSGASISTMCDHLLRPGTRLAISFGVGAGSLTLASMVSDQSNLMLCFSAFMAFEFCVGVYFPSIGILKSEVVPERVRGTMYNIYRVPLNAVVVALLLTNMSIVRVYELCALLLGIALVGICVVISSQPKLHLEQKIVKHV